MKLSTSEKIAGQPAKVMRDFARVSDAHFWNTKKIAEHFGVDDGVGQLRRLVRAKILELDKKRTDMIEGGPWYKSGPEAGQLACANFIKPITRARADELLQGVIARAKEINKGEPFDFGHVVRELRVFGSYTDETCESLDDVDIAVDIPRHPALSDQEYEDLAYRKSDGWSLDLLSMLAMNENDTLRFLKNRHPHISLHSLNELRRIRRKGTQVFHEAKYDHLKP